MKATIPVAAQLEVAFWILPEPDETVDQLITRIEDSGLYQIIEVREDRVQVKGT